MSQAQDDPAPRWAHHLGELDPARRDAVTAALQHSADTGWPASDRAVELLVAYASGAITSTDYATGILRSFGEAHPVAPRPDDAVSAESDPAPASATAELDDPGTISREDAVHAYVTGRIPVGEFLRLARS